MLKVLQPVEPMFKRAKIDNNKAFKNLLTYATKTKMSKTYKQISIPVTDLAPLCGMDHYNNWGKAICKLWKQTYPIDYQQVSEFVDSKNVSCVTDTTYMKIKKLQQRTGTKARVTNKVWQLNQKRDKSTTTLQKGQMDITNDIKRCSKMSLEEKKEMISLMNSATNVVYGTQNENIGISEFERITGKKVKESQTKLVHPWAEDTLINGEKIQWVITGKFDGLTENNELVEVKNRQSRLFNTIRDYEKCQIQMYLNMLGLSTGYLVEVIRHGETPSTSIIQESYDDAYMESSIMPHLESVRQFVLNIPYMSDSDKFKLLSGERKTM